MRSHGAQARPPSSGRCASPIVQTHVNNTRDVCVCQPHPQASRMLSCSCIFGIRVCAALNQRDRGPKVELDVSTTRIRCASRKHRRDEVLICVRVVSYCFRMSIIKQEADYVQDRPSPNIGTRRFGHPHWLWLRASIGSPGGIPPSKNHCELEALCA
jgi:hypothetical protein